MKTQLAVPPFSTVVNINGKLHFASEPPKEGKPKNSERPTHSGVLNQAKVSVFDRSYLYGDSLYEVVRTYSGEFFLLDEHLERLRESAALCHLSLTQDLAFLKSEILRTYQAFRQKFSELSPGCPPPEAYLRIVLSRGEGKIGFGLGCLESGTLYTIYVQEVAPPTPAQIQKGLRLQIIPRLRNSPLALDPAMKSGNYLNSLLGYLEAQEAGFDDALLCNADGHLTEGTTFNIFYIRNGLLATPPLEIGILDGITRRAVIALARSLGLPVREVRFPRERLYEADEVFITSSVREVFPVTAVDSAPGARFLARKPGPITLQLREAYRQTIEKRSTSAKPQARVKS